MSVRSFAIKYIYYIIYHMLLVADTRLYTLPCRSVGPSVRPSHIWIASGFCITAHAQPSATVLPCIQPCLPNHGKKKLLSVTNPLITMNYTEATCFFKVSLSITKKSMTWSRRYSKYRCFENVSVMIRNLIYAQRTYKEWTNKFHKMVEMKSDFEKVGKEVFHRMNCCTHHIIGRLW